MMQGSADDTRIGGFFSRAVRPVGFKFSAGAKLERQAEGLSYFGLLLFAVSQERCEPG